jgi:hypothetical protein
MSDELMAICWHEAAHALAAHKRGWPTVLITVAVGSRNRGCTEYRAARPVAADISTDAPFCTWPADYVRYLESDALVALAGPAAEAMWWDLVQMNAVEELLAAEPEPAVEFTPPTVEQSARALRVVEAEIPTDWQKAENAARMAFGSYDVGSRHAWQTLMECQAAALVRANVGPIGELASRLADAGTLSGEAVEQLLSGRWRLSPVR